MKKVLVIILLFMAFIFQLKSQNLVQNYSFENYYTCPTTDNSIGYIEHWGGDIQYISTSTVLQFQMVVILRVFLAINMLIQGMLTWVFILI